MADALRPCPRCGPDAALVPHEGTLHESICPRCLGRFLPSDARETLLGELQIDDVTLREMVKTFAGERLVCPGCGFKTSAIRLRGRSAGMCTGCGGMWLDQGDLSKVTGERLREVGVSERDQALLPPRPPLQMPDLPPKVARGYRAVQVGLFVGWAGLMGLLKLALDFSGAPVNQRLFSSLVVSSAYLVYFMPTLVARRKRAFLSLFVANLFSALFPPLWLYVAAKSVTAASLDERLPAEKGPPEAKPGTLEPRRLRASA